MQLFLGNQPGLAGPGQPVDLRTHVVLRNMSAGSVGVSASASFTRGNAVGEYDLNGLQRQGLIPRGVSEVLLKVDYFAAPGSLMGRAYSISSDLSFGLYSVLETDGTGYFSGVYWSLNDDENTVFTVANIGDKEEAVALNLAYAGGAVELPAFPLLPGQSQTVNLRRDLARMLRGKGQELPEGAVFGGYQVKSVDDPLRAELVVKEHVLNATKKTAAPFYGSCAYVTSIYMSGEQWPTIDMNIGSTRNLSPRCNWSTGGSDADYGAVLQPDGGGEISISPQYGYTRTVTALAGGIRNLLFSSAVPVQGSSCLPQILQGNAPPVKVRAPHSIAVSSTTSQGPIGFPTCPTGFPGYFRDVMNQLRDQFGANYQVGGITVSDFISIGSPNDLGVIGAATGTDVTNSTGTFPDFYVVCSTGCPASTGETHALQNWTWNSTPLPHTNVVVYKCNSIKIDGK